ncbi:hypothetical protein FOZ62_025267 [Perkinsus olseni]|uniref:JmjC domain-containing protein n=1 Tax=Perkinsus olseni TaxID=32597 RepID=A0A7J6UB11_PEROL|nr:hypothetical protein FOZ62_025267 [Perkinsus olseni]
MSFLRRKCRQWLVPAWSPRWATLIHHHVRRTTSLNALRDLSRPTQGLPNSIVPNRKAVQGRDVNALYVSSHHSSIDNRTPLMAALLATPRHKANAIMSGTMKVPSMEADSLYGYTFCKDGGPAGPVSSVEVRQGLWRWQEDACDLIMNAEDLDAARRDRNGSTTIHLAAAAGNQRVVDKLLDAANRLGGEDRVRCLLQAKDGHGRTPADLASAWGWTEMSDFLLSLGGERTIHESTPVEYDPLRLNKDRRINWDSYLAMNRPVIFRSLLPDFVWEGGFKSIPDSLLAQRLTVSQIPYGGVLGHRQESVRLSEYLLRYASADSASQAPLYGFDATLGHKHPLIKYYAEALLTLLGGDKVAYARYPQFGIGPRRAGSQMHTHHAALNLLLCGRKRWLLLPSRYAFWSHEPSVSQWKAWQQLDHVIEIEQLPGDVIYVPEFWGHATLIEEDAPTVAIEFIPSLSVHA